MNCLRAARGGSMARYPNISDHGLIGDLQTAALVTDDGTVNWFCSPRFDSPSIFAALLDADKGGHFKIAPDRDDYVTKQLYLPETAVLITRFMTPDGVGEVLDFMPIAYGRPTDRHRLVRQLRVPRGTMRFAMDLQPRFDYGRAQHTVDVTENGAAIRVGSHPRSTVTPSSNGGERLSTSYGRESRRSSSCPIRRRVS